MAADSAPPRSDYERSWQLLRVGRFKEGFALYDARLESGAVLPSGWTLGRGNQLLPGMEVAGVDVGVFPEQGYGDIFMFARFVEELAHRGAKVTLCVREETAAVLRTLPGLQRVVLMPVGERRVFPLNFQRWIFLGSLPRYLGTELRDLHGSSYLKSPAGFGPLLTLPPGPKVGFCWAGQTNKPWRAARALPLSQLRPLLQGPFTAVSLQRDLQPGDATALTAMPDVMRLGETFRDFGDAAAAIDRLDLVVTIDTAIAHLAGAMGKPTWILLREPADWRWFHGRADSPWYASARLFRQVQSGDWSPVIVEVRRELDRMFGKAALAKA